VAVEAPCRSGTVRARRSQHQGQNRGVSSVVGHTRQCQKPNGDVVIKEAGRVHVGLPRKRTLQVDTDIIVCWLKCTRGVVAVDSRCPRRGMW